MLKHTKLNKRTLVRWKVYIDRARMYIGYINFFMIGIVFLKSIEDEPIGKLVFENAYWSLPILILVFLIFSLILGYVDSKLGLREEEMRNASSSNPILMEILDKVNRLEESVNTNSNKHP